MEITNKFNFKSMDDWIPIYIQLKDTCEQLPGHYVYGSDSCHDRRRLTYNLLCSDLRELYVKGQLISYSGQNRKIAGKFKKGKSKSQKNDIKKFAIEIEKFYRKLVWALLEN